MATKDKQPEQTNRDRVLAVIEYIEGGMSERKACETVGIDRSTFRNTALRNKVDTQYARALEGLAMDQVESIEKTIADMRNGVIDSQMARVELDARKWFASKFLPKRFGDKLDVVSDGEKLEGLVIIRDSDKKP